MGNENDIFMLHLNYYIFQKRIHNCFTKNKSPENRRIEIGYIIQKEWIDEWKKMKGYSYLYTIFEKLQINNENITKEQRHYINEFINSEGIVIVPNNPIIEKPKNYISLKDKNITSEKNLDNFVNEKFFMNIKNIKKENIFEKVNYIFKDNLIIFFFENEKLIKVLMNHSCISSNHKSYSNNLININLVFNRNHHFFKYKKMFKYKNTKEIIDILNEKIFSLKKDEN